MSNLSLFAMMDEIREWCSMEWCDKEIEGKMFCMEFIEPFIEIEHYIENPNNKKMLIESMLSEYSHEDLRNIKRLYEETKHFVGFNSLEVNFFLDDLIDEVKLKEILEDESNGISGGYRIHGKL